MIGHVIASAAFSWSDFTSYVPLLTDGGVAGIWIIAYLRGWIASPSEVRRAEEEKERWRELFVTEQRAHEQTRHALADASSRAEAAIESSRMIASAIAGVHTDREASGKAAQGARTGGSHGPHRGT